MGEEGEREKQRGRKVKGGKGGREEERKEAAWIVCRAWEITALDLNHFLHALQADNSWKLSTTYCL